MFKLDLIFFKALRLLNILKTNSKKFYRQKHLQCIHSRTCRAAEAIAPSKSQNLSKIKIFRAAIEKILGQRQGIIWAKQIFVQRK